MFDPSLWVLWALFVTVVLFAFAADAMLALPRGRIEIDVQFPPLLHIGRPSSATISLHTPSWDRPTAIDVLVDLDEDLERQPVFAAGIPAAGFVSLVVPLIARRRGRPAARGLWLRWTGPLGLARRQLEHPLEHALDVIPDTKSVRAAAVRFFGTREFARGLKVERHQGEGTDFDSLREYVPGLDSRSIDWKASARHTKLVCREHRAERDHQVYLVFDTGHLMGEPMAGIPKLDHAVNAALLLAYVCLRTGDRVGMHAFDESVGMHHKPRGGMAALRALQFRTAELDYGTGETNFTLGLTDLLTRITRRSLVILFTDFVDTVTAELMLDNVRRLAAKHVLVFVALRDAELDAVAAEQPRSLMALGRAVSAQDLVRERDAVIGRLRRMGVLCVDSAPGQVSAEVISHYLDVKRRERVA